MTKFTYISRNVYAFFLGWINGAMNLNFGILIVYWWGATYETQLIIFWILTPLWGIGITVFNVKTEGKKGILCSFCFWISSIWAFVGSAMSSYDCLTYSD